MRRAPLFAVAIGVLAFSQAASATITYYSTRVAGTGANVGYDVIRFFAKFSPGGIEDQPKVGGTGSNGLDGVAATMTSTAPFKFQFNNVDLDGSTVAGDQPGEVGIQLDLIGLRSKGTGGNVYSNNSTVGTFIGVRPYDLAANQQGVFFGTGITLDPFSGTGDNPPQEPSDNNFDGDVTDPGDVNPVALYQNNQTSFRVEGVNFNSTNTAPVADPSAKSLNVNYNRGALFALAVVPTGATVRLAAGGVKPSQQIGSLADDNNHNTVLDITDAIPEPGSISLLTLGAIGLLARRSRKQA